MTTLQPPMAMLAELTHRCPMHCPYCSNPVQLDAIDNELDTATWQRVFDEAAQLGVLQVHFSGGEPAARRDLPELVAHARSRGLYTNLITSGLPLNARRVGTLAEAGLEHVQLSIQDADAGNADRIGGVPGAQQRKQAVADYVVAAGLPLTINAVVHRQNLAHLPRIIQLALNWGAQRLEVAHAQYYGWALENRAALMPTRTQLEEATRTVNVAAERLAGRLQIDYVVPDYHARRPKACMGGWGQRFFNVSPAGKVLPCHAAETIPDLVFDNVRDKSLEDIWQNSPAFRRFRGTEWMPEPCRSCEWREVDWGGCRCQAQALAGRADVTDPVCQYSPDHGVPAGLAAADAAQDAFVPRTSPPRASGIVETAPSKSSESVAATRQGVEGSFPTS